MKDNVREMNVPWICGWLRNIMMKREVLFDVSPSSSLPESVGY
jgi:hypothetical protein